MGVVDVIGFLAAVISFVLFIPQAQRVWKYRKHPSWLKAVSIWTQLFVLMNASLCGVYAVITGSFWVGAPGLVNAPLAIIVLILVIRARSVESRTVDNCLLCMNDVTHKIIYIEGDRRGEVVSCSSESFHVGLVVRDEDDVEKVLSMFI